MALLAACIDLASDVLSVRATFEKESLCLINFHLQKKNLISKLSESLFFIDLLLE